MTASAGRIDGRAFRKFDPFRSLDISLSETGFTRLLMAFSGLGHLVGRRGLRRVKCKS
jgi:hypothetical protein